MLKPFDFDSMMSDAPDYSAEQFEQLRKDSELRDQLEAKAKLIENRIKALSAPRRFADKDLANYKTDESSARAYRACVRYAENFEDNLKLGRSAIFSGLAGTGKTHLAVGLGKEIIKRGRSAKYTTAREIIASIRDSWTNSKVSEAEVIQRLVHFDLLIVDEVGVQFGTESERVHFFDVIGKRYDEVKPTILVGNISIAEMGESLGERVIDRMRENGGFALEFDWSSHRSGGAA